MHEMGVVIQIVKTANSYAEKSGAKEVKKLTLQIGELSPVLPQYVRMFFDTVIQDYQLLKDCELQIETEEPIAFCLDCGNSFNPSSIGSYCPECRSKSFKIIQGESLMIKEMEIV